MSDPKSFPGQIQVAIIGGGDVNDPAEDHSCNQRVYSPLEHNPDGVKLKHLAFSPMSHSPTNHSQQSFPGCLDPGTLVYVLKNTGSNQVQILGQANDFHNSETNRIPGNLDLMSNPIVNELLERTIQILIPPNIEEKEERGAKVKKIKEKGKEHKHNLLKGLPTHGALMDMSGLRLPDVKKVPTALQHYQNLMTNDMMSNMPGSLMSLGQMFQGLMGGLGGGGGGGGGGGAPAGGGGAPAGGGGAPVGGVANTTQNQINFGTGYDYTRDRMPEITAKMSPEMRDATYSLSTLVQGFESTGYQGSYATGGRVHVPTYLDNAAELLSQATNVYELMDVLHRLQGDETLFGTEKLETVVYDIETFEGTTKQYVMANGFVYMDQTAAMQNNSNTFANNVTSPSSAPSAGGAGNGGMMGNQGSNIMDMLKRVSPEAEKKMKEVLEKVTTGKHGKVSNPIVDALVKGKNPLSKDLFNSQG